MFGDLRIDELAVQRFEAFERAILIRYVKTNTLVFTMI
jgi:hypothetical protein